MKEYTPVESFETIRQDTLLPLGNYISIEKIEKHKKYNHIFYHYLKYEKLGLKIKYVFCDKKIHGLWFGYYEIKEK
jgi:hypothetical protein